MESSLRPRLLCIAGPSKGETVFLNEQQFIIGRDRTNPLFIPDLMLSRRHCSISKEPQGSVIRDLESRNGVFVNSTPIQERLLRHGDRIEIGSTTLIYLDHEEIHEDENVIDTTLDTAPTLALPLDESQYLKEVQASGRNPAAVLIDVSQKLNAAQNLDAFYKKLQQLFLELTAYERITILDPTSARVIRTEGKSKTFQRKISRKIFESAIAQKAAIFASGFSSAAASLSGTEIQAVLAVPFVWEGRVLCIVYMDTAQPFSSTQDHGLQLATAVANLASPILSHIVEEQRLRDENSELKNMTIADRAFIGESEVIKKVKQTISKIAASEATILILGESGTGKELAARSIHAASSRCQHPFVAINCAAFPESLMESELFGHEKGSFTGAVQQKKGKIEIANQGSLFLDEIGELPLALQAKLLRVLQEREFERVGGLRPIPLNIRIIAATNQDLKKAVEEGRFRNDLYYRLNVVTLNMPPLRELGKDVLLLAQYFIAKFSLKEGKRVRGLSEEAKAALLRHDWPGNIRELQNAIEHAIVLGATDLVMQEYLPEYLLENALISTEEKDGGSYHEALLHTKRKLVLKAFEGIKGNYTEAAARLGLHPNHLYRLVKNLNLKDQV